MSRYEILDKHTFFVLSFVCFVRNGFLIASWTLSSLWYCSEKSFLLAFLNKKYINMCINRGSNLFGWRPTRWLHYIFCIDKATSKCFNYKSEIIFAPYYGIYYEHCRCHSVRIILRKLAPTICVVYLESPTKKNLNW